jgi:putative DNA primase/helicase
LFFLYGGGANGKSVFINTLIGIWNDYALTIGTDMLMVSNTDRHPTEIARLRGARLAVGSEVEIGRTWAESKIKGLTGGDRLQGRYMRQDFFEFDPQFKLMIVGNHKPSLRGVDEAIRRRLHLIPFTVTIPTAERDRDLPEKLKAEWPAILRWAIDGCLEWQRQGLNPPAAVCDATKDYLASEDTLGQWIGERCVLSPAIDWTSVKCLYDDWRDWAMTRGNHPGSTKSFSQRLDERGFERKTRNKGPGFLGIGLAQEQAGTGQGERSERSPYNGRIDGVFARMRGQDPKSESLYAYYKSNSHFSNPCPDDVADQGREPLGICPVCRFTVCRDNAVQTGGGAWLHPACLRR